ncbi:MAG: ABC transporter ATP-binding protein [Ferrovibrionaceae bacterium]
MSTTLLDVRDLVKHYPVGGGLFGRRAETVHAVDGVSFGVDAGETLAIVGESGCGKSTVGKVVLGLAPPTAGRVSFGGTDYAGIGAADMKRVRRRLQVVFQDPFSSMNPRMKVRDIVAEPLENFGVIDGRSAITDRVRDLLVRVGLPADALNRFPHEFSGGQRQRICIARALAPGADLIVCDEAVSALDVSVKAQIVNLLLDLQAEYGLALLFISHDIAVVEHMAHRVAVMYLGKIMEIGDRDVLFAQPAHPYTRALLSAVPVPDPAVRRGRAALAGDLPSPIDPPRGCRFHTRCPLAFDRCRVDEPALRAVGSGRLAACHLDQPADA